MCVPYNQIIVFIYFLYFDMIYSHLARWSGDRQVSFLFCLCMFLLNATASVFAISVPTIYFSFIITTSYVIMCAVFETIAALSDIRI